MIDPIPRKHTRYAVQHEDGRYLTLAYQRSQIVALWVPERDRAWTWPCMTSAVSAALEVLAAVGPWSVVAV
jgi:hypothetical protein